MPKALNSEQFNEKARAFYEAVVLQRSPTMATGTAKKLAATIGDISEYSHDPETAARIAYESDNPTDEQILRTRRIYRRLKTMYPRLTMPVYGRKIKP